MTKLFFVGDTHFDSSTPRSRIDDYPQTTLDKLEDILSKALSLEVKTIIFAGDFFSKTYCSLTYINSMISTLSKFQKEGIDLYTIVGNHDILYNRMDTLDRTPLKTLFLSGTLKPLDSITIKGDSTTPDVFIKGFDFPDDITGLEVKLPNTYNICVAHKFLESPFSVKDSITSDMVDTFGYNMWLLGHDHMQYPIGKIGETIVVRPGSLMRATADNYHLTREVAIAYIIISDKVAAKYLKIDTKPSEEVYTQDALSKSDRLITDVLTDLRENVNSLLNKMDVNRKNVSVYDVMRELKLPAEQWDLIAKYLAERGIYDTTKDTEAPN